MDSFDALLKAIANINSGLQLLAFAIAALALIAGYLPTRTEDGAQKSISVPPSLAWAVIIAMVILGALPTVANAWLKHEQNLAQERLLAVYRVRTLVLNPEDNPVSGASLRITAKNLASTGPDGTAELEIYRATMPADGRVTIYADMESEFLHGHSEIQSTKTQIHLSRSSWQHKVTRWFLDWLQTSDTTPSRMRR